MNRKKLLYIIGGVAAAVAILAMLYCRFASVTRVATLNFPDFTVEKFIRSNDNPFIKINPIGLDEAEKIAKYDIRKEVLLVGFSLLFFQRKQNLILF